MSVERVACPGCGALNDPEAAQCLICGAALSPYAGQAAPGGPPAPVVPPAPGAAPRRNSGPLIALVLGVVGVCLVAVLGLGALALVSGGGVPFLTPPTPTPVDPAQVLDAATAALADVQTMHYDMVVTFSDQPADPSTSPTVTLHLAGDVAFPDR